MKVFAVFSSILSGLSGAAFLKSLVDFSMQYEKFNSFFERNSKEISGILQIPPGSANSPELGLINLAYITRSVNESIVGQLKAERLLLALGLSSIAFILSLILFSYTMKHQA